MHQTRIHILGVLFIAVVGARLDAGSFLPPEPWDVKTPNGKYLVHVEPLKTDRKSFKVIRKPTATVFRVGPAGRRLLWKTDLVNDRCPDSVFLSDDGKTLVTVEDWGHDGYGPNTVVLYTRQGLLSRHSLKSALGLKKKDDLYRLPIPFTSAGMHWRQFSFEFFAATEKAHYFCIWVKYKPHWLCFNLDTGKQVKPAGALLKTLKDKARSLSLQDLQSDNRYARAVPIVFLEWLRRPEDRPRLSEQLTCPGFSTTKVSRVRLPPLDGGSAEDYIKQLAQASSTYEIESRIRGLADLALARWSGKTRKSIVWWSLDKQFALGSVGTEIQVPRSIRNRDGCLYLYLIKPPIRARAWEKPRPIHIGTIDIDKAEDGQAIRATYPVLWRHVLPGKYWLKVVWNANAPKDDTRPQVKGGPFEGVSSQVFSVKPSHRVNADKIQLKKMHNHPNAADASKPRR